LLHLILENRRVWQTYLMWFCVDISKVWYDVNNHFTTILDWSLMLKSCESGSNLTWNYSCEFLGHIVISVLSIPVIVGFCQMLCSL